MRNYAFRIVYVGCSVMRIKKKTAIIISAAVISAVAFFVCRTDKSLPENDIVLENEYALGSWLNLKGWKVGAPVCTEVTVPEKFSGIYNDYALIQQKLGLPLEKYKGRRVTRCLYSIENFGGDVPVTAELLVYDNKLIAAALLENKQGGRIMCP